MIIPKQRVSNLGRNSVILTPSWPTFRLHFAKLEILLVFISFKKLTLKTICKLNTSKKTKASFSNNFIDIAKVTLTQAYQRDVLAGTEYDLANYFVDFYMHIFLSKNQIYFYKEKLSEYTKLNQDQIIMTSSRILSCY